MLPVGSHPSRRASRALAETHGAQPTADGRSAASPPPHPPAAKARRSFHLCFCVAWLQVTEGGIEFKVDRFDDGRSNPYRVTFRDGDGVRSIYKFSTAGAVARIEAGSEKYKVSVVMRFYIYSLMYCVRGCFAHFNRCRLLFLFVKNSSNI